MKFINSDIEGLVEIQPSIYHDERGWFTETYNQQVFRINGLDLTFVQDNQSFSKKGVVRGLHFQRAPFAQGKLVRVVSGSALDVVVDIRPSSASFGQVRTFILDDKKCNMVYVPEGFAHGFAALEDTILSYKCTNLYNKASEGGICWNDPHLNINWQVDHPIVSEKDRQLPLWEEVILMAGHA